MDLKEATKLLDEQKVVTAEQALRINELESQLETSTAEMEAAYDELESVKAEFGIEDVQDEEQIKLYWMQPVDKRDGSQPTAFGFPLIEEGGLWVAFAPESRVADLVARGFYTDEPVDEPADEEDE